jgi:acetyl-CoA carboxylase carboxyltransferase component
MVWEPELDDIARREALAAEMGGAERVERQHASGRLTVRERLAAAVDAGSFTEIGGLAGQAAYDSDGELTGFRASNVLIGTATIARRPVVVVADDFTVRGGAADAAIHEKQVHAERLAAQRRVPLLRLVDGTGGGGSVKQLEELGHTYVPYNPGWDDVVANLSRVPVVACVLGPVAGLGAARAVTSHYSVMVRGSTQLFAAGPPVVKWAFGREVTKEELGGAAMHTQESGAVDDAVDTEEELYARVRAFLSYLPDNVWELPPVTATEDDPQRAEPELRSLIPRERRRPHDARRLLDLVLDRGSVLELQRDFGRSLITALGRLDGHPVAVITEDPTVLGGGMTADAADKLTRFVDLADTFHLPIVRVVDQPGFVVGIDAERAGTIRKGARALAAIYQASVPQFTVIVRRVFGVAGAGHSAHQLAQERIAWPSADWGSLPVEGGIEAAYRRDLEAADDPAALRAEIHARMEAVRSPLRTAEVFGIERIVDPADTRAILTEWVHGAYRVMSHDLGPTARGLRP